MRTRSAVLTAALNDAERAYGPGHPECVIIRDEVAAGYRAAGSSTRRSGCTDSSWESGSAAWAASILTRCDAPAARRDISRRRAVKEAFSQYKKAVSDLQRSQGPDHPDTLRAHGPLAGAYHQAGRMPIVGAALRAGARVPVRGQRHRTTPNALGRAESRPGLLRRRAADRCRRRLLEDTVARGERVLAPADPITKAARESLAAIVGEAAQPAAEA